MNIKNIIERLPQPKVGTFIDQGVENPLSIASEIAKLTNAKNLFEIGTHVGYSSLLFLLNDFNVYSTDINDVWTTTENLEKVQIVFNEFFPNQYKQIIRSSQEHNFFLEYFSKINLDIIHVDGLHTYESCKNDIELGKKLKIKYFLIDDYQHIEMQNATIDTNLKLIKLWSAVHSVVCDVALFEFDYEN